MWFTPEPSYSKTTPSGSFSSNQVSAVSWFANTLVWSLSPTCLLLSTYISTVYQTAFVPLNLELLIRRNLLRHVQQNHSRNGACDQAGQRHEEIGFHWSPVVAARVMPLGKLATVGCPDPRLLKSETNGSSGLLHRANSNAPLAPLRRIPVALPRREGVEGLRLTSWLGGASGCSAFAISCLP
jgi:hypothetical protein